MARDINQESEPDSDEESLEQEQNPLDCIAPAVLADLKHLDLTGRIVLKKGRVISGGSYGDISKAKCQLREDEKVTVAVKRLRFYLKDDIKMLFEKEIYVWARLGHPNILPLLGYAFDSMTGFPLLISQWMKNGSAWNFVLSHVDCNLMRIVTGIARGIAYLHQNGVVHSDIKSDNVLITDTEDAVICDFGCSRMLAASQSLALMSTGIKGTPQYLAYELLADPSSKHSTKTDVWAFGMTVFELVTRQRPYADISTGQVLMSILKRELPTAPGLTSTTSSEIDQKFLDICQLCWRYDPVERADMDAIVSRLEENCPPPEATCESRKEASNANMDDAKPEERPPRTSHRRWSFSSEPTPPGWRTPSVRSSYIPSPENGLPQNMVPLPSRRPSRRPASSTPSSEFSDYYPSSGEFSTGWTPSPEPEPS